MFTYLILLPIANSFSFSELLMNLRIDWGNLKVDFIILFSLHQPKFDS